jgi:hypothetical protein
MDLLGPLVNAILSNVLGIKISHKKNTFWRFWTLIGGQPENRCCTRRKAGERIVHLGGFGSHSVVGLQVCTLKDSCCMVDLQEHVREL